MKIGIFPGSFKPPHKGHFQLVKDAIKKDKLDKVIIIISKHSRYLDDKIQNPSDYSKEELSKHFKQSFPTKSAAISYTKEAKMGDKVDPILAKEIWGFYLSTLNVLYEIKIGFFFSPMINSNVYLAKELKRDGDKIKNKYFLYKSSKDEENSRFDFIEKKYGQNEVIFRSMKLKYNINGRDFREDILAKKDITKYLPSLPILTLQKIKKSLKI